MQSLLFSPYKAILFDLDNTLCDFVELMTRGANATAAYLGVGTGAELLSYYLRGKYHVEDHMNLQDFMVDQNCFTAERYFAAVKVFDAARYEGIVPFPGIAKVLQKFRDAGMIMGVITDAYTEAANKRLENSGLKKYFSFVVGFDTTGYKKPNHEPFEYALAQTGCEPYEVAYVGDSLKRDIYPAIALGMTAVHARYGDHTFFRNDPLDLPVPHLLVAEKPEDILSLLPITED